MTLPRIGNEKAPILIVLDPVVGNPYASKPLSGNDVEWFKPRIQKYCKIDKDKFQFISACRPVSMEEWTSDRKISEVLKEDEDEFVKTVNSIKPKIIVAMGAKAVKQCVGRSVKITKVRGTILDNSKHFSDTEILALTSPFYARKHPEGENLFCADLETLGRIVKSGYDSSSVKARTTITSEWCFDIQHLLDNPPKLVSLDCETTGLVAYEKSTRLLSVQLTYEAGKSLVIPIDYDSQDIRHHNYIKFPKPYPVYRKHILAQLKKLLENPYVKIIGQNIKFDWLILFYKAGIVANGIVGDTQLLCHLLNENMVTFNIDDLIRVYVPELAGFNDILNKDTEHLAKTRMDLFTPEKFLTYSGNDTAATYALYTRVLPLVKKDKKLYACYKHTVMRAVRAFCHVEINGFPVDVNALKEFEKELKVIQRKEKKWLLNQIPQSIKNKWKDSGVGLKPDRAAILLDYLYLHKDGLRLPVIVKTKTGQPSVSTKQVMPYYVADYPFVARLVDYVKNQKMLSTYVKGFYKYIVDGLIRPTFNFHKTVTGRSSCIHADTPIPTNRGIVRVADIKIGDLVLTHKNRLRMVVRKYIKPVQDMYDVTLSNRQTIRCTEEHRFLTSTGTWESLRNVCIKAALGRYPTAAENSLPLHRILADFDAGGKRNGVDYRYSDENSSRGFGARPVQDLQDCKVLCLEARKQEPDAWQKTSQSQTESISRGWTWILDDSSGSKAILCSSRCDGTGDWSAPFTATRNDGRASHRRKSKEQQFGQFGVGYAPRAQGDSCSAARILQTVAITQVHHCGSYPVYDFEVEDDHSYAACGVFNHNSEHPNGQNFPKRGKMAKLFRRIFRAPKGWLYGQNDLSQAELRIAAMMSNDTAMKRVYQEGGDIHASTAAGVMGITLEQFKALDDKIKSLKRFQAKAVNFGFLYGMWWKKFRQYAKTDYGIDFSEEEAQSIREQFFKTYPSLETWHRAVEDFVMEHGYVRAYNGRIRHLPMVHSPDESVRKQAIRQAINSPVQSFASDLGLMAIGILVPLIKKNGYDKFLKICGFIHDSIVYLVKEEHAAFAARLIKRVMENIPLQTWFGFKPSVPIIADVEIGETLADTYEFKPQHYSKESGNKSFEDMKKALLGKDYVPPVRKISRPKPLVKSKPPGYTRVLPKNHAAQEPRRGKSTSR
jgi:DNA polymerase I-like protein with 3'-5' exonuclease and polymerase domains